MTMIAIPASLNGFARSWNTTKERTVTQTSSERDYRVKQRKFPIAQGQHQ